MRTVCKKDNHMQYEFQQANNRRVVAGFDGGQLTSDGGAVLLSEFINQTGILADTAGCFIDRRDPARTTHTIDQLVRQRVLGLVCGYEDLLDHEQLRADPMWGLLAGKADPEEQPIAGKSTLNRLEISVAREAGPDRYHKIDLDEEAFAGMFTQWYIGAHQQDPPSQVILDLDATDNPLHGRQEGRFFHGYYDHYCYLPLYIFAGDQLLWAELRRSNIDASRGSVEAVARIVARLREAWPTVRIILRADSGFARDRLMSWCEAHGVDYVFGLAKNARLKQAIGVQGEALARLHHQTGQTERMFSEFSYQTRDSWSRSRRVIGKAACGPRGANPRFVVTSLHPAHWPAAECYEQLYCARGEAENRIKEQQLGLFGNRSSCGRMAGNQLRLWFSAVAYWLVSEFRRVGLAGTRWARAQGSTIRQKLLKIGGLVRVSVRRIKLALSSGYPWKTLFEQVWGNLRSRWGPG